MLRLQRRKWPNPFGLVAWRFFTAMRRRTYIHNHLWSNNPLAGKSPPDRGGFAATPGAGLAPPAPSAVAPPPRIRRATAAPMAGHSECGQSACGHSFATPWRNFERRPRGPRHPNRHPSGDRAVPWRTMTHDRRPSQRLPRAWSAWFAPMVRRTPPIRRATSGATPFNGLGEFPSPFRGTQRALTERTANSR